MNVDLEVGRHVAHVAHVAAALAVVLLIAVAGREAARRMHQPEVIGEITAGLLAGPAALLLLGDARFAAVLPAPVSGDLRLIGQVGLVLFLVGLVHHVRAGAATPAAGGTLAVSAGALFPPLVSGVVMACWVIAVDDPAVRGTAPPAAFVLTVAVAMSISAVPVMARILAFRRMTHSTAGTVTMASAVVVDSACWLLLTAAICLRTGSVGAFLQSLLALVLGGVSAFAVRSALHSRFGGALCRRAPAGTAVVLGVVALAVATAVERLGMTAILGAALVGLVVPVSGSASWDPVVALISRVGNLLIPTFFVVIGITVFSRSTTGTPFTLIAVSIALAVLGKGGGSYWGARLSGHSRHVSRHIAVLMNTRGLTELIVLQAGLSAGILTPSLVLALTVMALVTTSMTGPLLSWLDGGAPPSAGAGDNPGTRSG